MSLQPAARDPRKHLMLPAWAAVLLLLGVVASCSRSAVATDAKPSAPACESPSDNKPSDAELRQRLTPLQYKVTQKQATEKPFANEYWDNHRPGIYVDVVSGEPLFSSLDKFDSGTGWPSFTKPLAPENLVSKPDRSLGVERIEIRSKSADSHLGHLFDDGPAPTGQRYCMNSAAMRFIPVEKLAEEGYGQYLPLFGKSDASPVGAPMVMTAAFKKEAAVRETATLAGGCFWGMEEIIRGIPGVIETKVGYTGGFTANPKYTDVKTGETGHAEAVQVIFDPKKLSYEELLGWFFRMHDPTTLNRQGNDVGTQYRSAIFYHSPEQKEIAERVKAKVEQSGKWKRPIVTQIVPAGSFTPAEEYHQDYLQKNPGGYTCHYLRD